MAGAEIAAVGLDHQFTVGSSGRRGNQPDLRRARGGTIEREPRMDDRMRFDRDHLAAGANVMRQHHCIGADVSADIDEHAALRGVRAEEIQLFDIVVAIEKRATFSGAGLMIQSKRRALILCIYRAGSQQVEQARQHRSKCATLEPRALRERDDGSLRARGRECIEGGRGRIVGRRNPA